MKKKWFLIVIIIAIFSVGIFFYNKKNIYINIVLSQSSYNYLSKEAKNYIKEVYNKTGNVLKTEKNKEKENNSLNITLITILVIVIVIAILIILYVFKGKLKFKKNKENTVKSVIDNTDVI